MTYLYMYPNSQIASGYNNTGGLAAWESIVPTGDVAFFAPVIYGSFDVGDRNSDSVVRQSMSDLDRLKRVGSSHAGAALLPANCVLQWRLLW